jgi:DNA-binding NtrC family response regulator
LKTLGVEIGSFSIGRAERAWYLEITLRARSRAQVQRYDSCSSRCPEEGQVGEESSTRFVPPPGAACMRVRAANLEVLSGPDQGRWVRIDRPVFVIGSGVSADLRLSDPTVSREHLRMYLTPSGLEIKDEVSKNGTWIGGLRIRDSLISMPTVLDLGTTRLSLGLEAGPLDLELSRHERFGRAIGVSAAMRNVFAVLERAAESDVSVLLEGESGVGKEVLAQAVHASSGRAGGPFVTIDCGAIPPTLIESELFGHERGAFTDANKSSIGVFAQGDGGTIFLDEIGDLPLELQPKLLRVLEQREIRRLGGVEMRRIDVRIIAATNRRLSEAVQSKEFRRDLFYRLAVARVTIPPLRDRPEDILPIAKELLALAANDRGLDLPVDFAAMLTGYHWPGNVRELRNVIDRYVYLGLRDTQSLFDSKSPPLEAAHVDLSRLSYHEARRRAVDAFERAYVPKVMDRAGGVITRALELSGMGRTSFYRMLERVRRPNQVSES